MKIFIAKLPYEYQETDIAALFAPYGEVATVNLIMDRETGRSKCYAFVEMPNESEANNAISSLDQKEINSKQLAVSQAQERPKTNGSSSNFNRGISRGGSGSGSYQQRSNSGHNRDRDSYNKGSYNRNNKSDSDY
jgi:RNA recognition motif-containing protein